MADENSFEMTILKKDRAIVYELLFGDSNYFQCNEIDNQDGTTTFTKEEANYGSYEYEIKDADMVTVGTGAPVENHGYLWQREKLAKSEIFFYGEHCWAYGERAFACYKGNHLEVNTMDGIPAILVNRNGGVDNIALEKVRKYYQTLDLVEKYFAEDHLVYLLEKNANS